MSNFTRCPCELSLQAGIKSPKLFYAGSQKPQILIIGKWPSYQDDKSGKLFSGFEGKYLRKQLKTNGVDIKNVGWTNVLSCRPVETKPTKEHYQPCIRELRKLLEKKSKFIKLIFLVGDIPLRQLLGYSSLKKYRGNILRLGETICVPLYSPLEVQKSKQKEKLLEMDIQKGIAAINIKRVDINWKMVDAKQLKQLIPEIKQAKKLTFDTETTGLNQYADQFYVVGIGFCWDGVGNSGVFLPLEHKDLSITAKEYVARIEVIKEVLVLDLPKEAYNGEYDLKCLSIALDIDLYGIKNYCKDPIHAYHLYDCNYTPTLSNLTLDHLPDLAGYDMTMELLKSKYGSKYMTESPLDVIAKYCVGDCISTHRIGDILEDKLKKIGSYDLYTNLVVPSSKIYTLISLRGVKIDPVEAQRLTEVYEDKITEMSEKLLALPCVKEWEEVKHEKLSLTSSKQKMDLVYDFYKIPEETTKRKNSETGSVEWTRSLDRSSVREIISNRGESVYVGGVMDFLEGLDQFSMLKTTQTRYTSCWQDWLYADGLVHSRFNNRGTKSGRLSVTHPNLQQMPTRIDTKDPELIEWLTNNAVKKMITSKYSNGCLVEGDYSQVELRIMAILSEDKLMLQTYQENGDIHLTTARRKFPQFDNQPPKIQKSLRIKAKTVNFKGAYSFDPEFLEVYPGLSAFVTKSKKQALVQGWSEDLLHRRRVIPNLGLDVPKKKVYSMNEEERDNYFRRESALRAAINHKIQGLAHELLEDSLIRIDQRLHESGLAEIVLETHDSLTADVHNKKDAKIVAIILKEEMEKVNEIYDWITAPIIVNIEVGLNWWNMNELELD